MTRIQRIIVAGLLLCLLGAAGKGYGQEVDIKTNKWYKGLVAAWNFDGDTENFLSGEKLKVNKGEVAYTMDRNLEEGKALLVQKGQFVSGLNVLLPQGDSPRTVMFWMRKTGCGNADITLLHFGDNSKPRGSMNIRLRPCAEWGDYMTTSFVPDLEGNHKYSDALEGDFYGGLWSHIAITYYKGIVRAYCNGLAVKNYPPSAKAQRADTASAEVALGWVMSSDENDDTVICLDDVRVFSSALNSRKISWIYENEFSERGELDTDEDGLSDSYEVFLLKTNPNLADTDDDGLSDSDEIKGGVGVVEGNFNWYEARADAEGRGGHLATITSAEENKVYSDYLLELYDGKYPGLWLGATDEKEEGDWSWVTGEEWVYENWDKAGGEPNNDNNGTEHYLHIISSDVVGRDAGKWNDLVNTKTFGGGWQPIGYLIEYSNQYRSDPLDPDSDDDGVSDGDEVKAKTNPADALDFPEQQIDITTDERYEGLVAAWNFDGSLEEKISKKKLKPNKGTAKFFDDAGGNKDSALLVQKGQFFKETYESLPVGDAERTIMFWYTKDKCTADIALLQFGDSSNPRGSVFVRARPCDQWGNYFTVSFVPDLKGVHKYHDSIKPTLFSGAWIHIAITYKRRQAEKFYYNGVQNNVYPDNRDIIDTATADAVFGWITNPDANDESVIGLDKVRVFSKRLTSLQIKKIYDNERPVFPPATIAFEKSEKRITLIANTVPGEKYVWERSKNLKRWLTSGGTFEASQFQERKIITPNSSFGFYRLKYIR